MVRAAAKNHDRVTVVVDPLDYGAVLAEIDRDGGAVSAEYAPAARGEGVRAHRAVRRAVAVVSRPRVTRADDGGADFPDLLPLQFRKRLDLRYGENPHQQAAFYVASDAQGAEHRLAPRSCRARNSRSTTSPTPTPRSSACGSSTSRPA